MCPGACRLGEARGVLVGKIMYVRAIARPYRAIARPYRAMARTYREICADYCADCSAALSSSITLRASSESGTILLSPNFTSLARAISSSRRARAVSLMTSAHPK